MSAADVERRIEQFIARYTPALLSHLPEARRMLCAEFPRGFELVFDNYNALVFGVSPTQLTSDSFLSIAAYPRWVTLFCLRGIAFLTREQS